jgi:hypothetical protein
MPNSDQPGRWPDVVERRGGFIETKGDSAFESYLRSGIMGDELRALASDVDPSGGYLLCRSAWLVKSSRA